MKKTIMAVMATILTMLLSCGPSMGGSDKTTGSQESATDGDNAPLAASTPASTTDDEGWSFATVPLPQGGVPPRFVSNPDSVLSADAEAELNRMLLYAKVDLGIESCVVVVNHVADSNVV